MRKRTGHRSGWPATLHRLGRQREPYDRSVDVHICNIRQKLQALAGEAIGIETGCNIGYRLA
ncbi:helix-turn-helix domain-containing protein [Aeromonas piscicola]|nr:helix-turn-helix domain-containing protein [Aeromonas piscicola]MCW0507537.1 helix-turn-helix domain-containing protein [Aeromonas piscicola]